MTFIIPIMKALNSLFLSNFIDFSDYQISTEKIKFAVLMILLGIVLLFVWLPYLNDVKKKIWRVKGMLNMIPMDIIGNNENLKVALISEDIAATVK